MPVQQPVLEAGTQVSRYRVERLVARGGMGPVYRARDVRLDRPYAAYARYAPPLALRPYGDARSRLEVRLDEIEASLELIQTLLAQLPAGPVAIAAPESWPAAVPSDAST